VSATTWVEDLRTAVRDYSRSRRRGPVVRVTLTSGVSRYVLSVSAGPNGELISLNLYPDADPGDLVEVERIEEGQRVVDRVTPELLVVPPHAIHKFELIYEHPGQPGIGFRI